MIFNIKDDLVKLRQELIAARGKINFRNSATMHYHFIRLTSNIDKIDEDLKEIALKEWNLDLFPIEAEKI